jgi:uncharacterized protein YyaL (SSP411 family)
VPNKVLIVASAPDGPAADVVPLLQGRTAINGSATAYVCHSGVCRAPVTSPEELAAQLS